MAAISLSQAFLALVWGVILYFISSVGHEVFDSSPKDLCDLCAVVNGTVRTRLIDSFESESLVAFKSKEPLCEKHFYVVTREHIKNVYSEEMNCSLVTHMVQVCHQILNEEDVVEGRVVFFDNPPFTTYSHLYLNCMICRGFDVSLANPQFYFNYLSQSFAPKWVLGC
jgi:hypothetical protein